MYVLVFRVINTSILRVELPGTGNWGENKKREELRTKQSAPKGRERLARRASGRANRAVRDVRHTA